MAVGCDDEPPQASYCLFVGSHLGFVMLGIFRSIRGYRRRDFNQMLIMYFNRGLFLLLDALHATSHGEISEFGGLCARPGLTPHFMVVMLSSIDWSQTVSSAIFDHARWLYPDEACGRIAVLAYPRAL